jgi:hypothetical protein
MGDEDKAGQTVKPSAGPAKGVLFVKAGTPIPNVGADIEVIAVNAEVIKAQVQRRT